MEHIWFCGLLMLGYLANMLLVVYAKDEATPEEIGVTDVIWKGAAKYKTMATVLFIFVLGLTLDGAAIEKIVELQAAGLPAGKFGVFVTGMVSENVMHKVVTIARKRVNGNGKGE